MRTELLASVLGQADVAVFQDNNMFIQRFRHHAQSFAHHVTTPALTVYLSRMPWFSMNARRFRRTLPLNGMGSALNSSKDVGVGTDLALTCG